MVTPRGTSFSTDEKAVAQADVQLLRKTVESLVVKFDQGKFEEFLSLGSASPKIMRHYHKVSSETRSRISSEVSPKVACTFAYSTSGATSNEVLKISRATHAAAPTSLRTPTWLMCRYMITMMVKINPTITLLSELCNSILLRVLDNPCGLIRMLNVNEGVVLVHNRLKILQGQSVMQI